MLVEKEELADLKEEMAEYQEDVQELKEITKADVSKLQETKGAKRFLIFSHNIDIHTNI